MARVHWTVGAEDDLDRISSAVAVTSEVYAAAFVDRLLAAVDRLVNYPRMGRVVPEYEMESICELIVGSHRLVYVHDPDADRVKIAAIAHGHRDLIGALGNDPAQRVKRPAALVAP